MRMEEFKEKSRLRKYQMEEEKKEEDS